MVDIENLTEKELDQLYKFYVQISKLAEKEDDLTCTHSIDAAEENNRNKSVKLKKRQLYIGQKSKNA